MTRWQSTAVGLVVANLMAADAPGPANRAPAWPFFALCMDTHDTKNRSLAEPVGVKLALYPHVSDWLERVEDAVRVARKTERPNVGVMFNLCHWLKVGDEQNLRPLLQSAQPHLFAVSINGSDRGAAVRAGTGVWIGPLDTGAFDWRDFLAALGGVGYTGPVGLQRYGITGDARDHLSRSMAAWRTLSPPPATPSSRP
jgi:sugar phosphate isomerase/epimerase